MVPFLLWNYMNSMAGNNVWILLNWLIPAFLIHDSQNLTNNLTEIQEVGTNIFTYARFHMVWVLLGTVILLYALFIWNAHLLTYNYQYVVVNVKLLSQWQLFSAWHWSIWKPGWKTILLPPCISYNYHSGRNGNIKHKVSTACVFFDSLIWMTK